MDSRGRRLTSSRSPIPNIRSSRPVAQNSTVPVRALGDRTRLPDHFGALTSSLPPRTGGPTPYVDTRPVFSFGEQPTLDPPPGFAIPLGAAGVGSFDYCMNKHRMLGHLGI